MTVVNDRLSPLALTALLSLFLGACTTYPTEPGSRARAAIVELADQHNAPPAPSAAPPAQPPSKKPLNKKPLNKKPPKAASPTRPQPQGHAAQAAQAAQAAPAAHAPVKPTAPAAPAPPPFSVTELSASLAVARTLDLTQDAASAWERIRRGFAIPNLESELVEYWTAYYAAHPEQLQHMTERARPFLYYVVDETHRRGLPMELALLPFIESAYNPQAYSSARAAGLWQFIPSTGQHYKLTQDWWRDERRDPVASTQAALDYLEYLFDFQGDWYLALASYNWGEGSVRRAIEQNRKQKQPTDYLSLKLPDETRHYVPKLQAIKNIIADPARYGVALPTVENTPYFEVIHKTRDIDVVLAARLADMPVAQFQALNPAFNRPLIRAAHAPKLLLPRDKVETFQARLAAHKGELSSWKTYRAKAGESLAEIAKRHGITLANLRTVNSLPPQQRSAQAGNLLVPRRPQAAQQLAELRLPGPGVLATRTHTVRAGESLWTLASRYHTTVQHLRVLNQLRGSLLRIGTRLRVPARS